MAKSLRSKWKRKMKVVKRERYGKRELERLKVIVEKAKENDAKIASETDVTMGNDELYTVVTRAVTRASRRRSRGGKDGNHVAEEDPEVEKMEPDQGKIKIYDPETLQDQHGTIPVWVGSHKRKKMKKTALKRKMMKKKLEKKKNKKRNNR